MYIFVNDTEITYVKHSVNITDQLQEKTNSMSFGSFDEYDSWSDIRAFAGFLVRSATSNTVTLESKENCNDLFREGDKVYFDVAEIDEETFIIQSIGFDGDGFLTLTATANFLNTPTSAKVCGILRFGGNILTVTDSNNVVLDNIEYKVSCIDYTRIFDHELVNETYEAKDGRYIINDFCNSFVNLTIEYDSFNDYENDTELQAEYLNSGDGDSPTLETTDIRQGAQAAVFPWTNSTGNAVFQTDYLTTNPINAERVLDTEDDGFILLEDGSFLLLEDGSKMIKEESIATSGYFTFWYKVSDFTQITNISFRIGNSPTKYIEWDVTPTNNEWNFFLGDVVDYDSSSVDAVNWQAVTYFLFDVTNTGDGNILLDDLRFLEKEHFRHYNFVQETAVFDNFNVSRVKPTELMQRISEELAWYWYIDYERNIHLFPQNKNISPFSLNETSKNFRSLSIGIDAKKIINSQIVEGAESESLSKTFDTRRGDGALRNWLTKTKFVNLQVFEDDESVTDLMEAGTTTETVNATAHGLSQNDYIVNRTRDNSLRQVLTVPDPNSFTVLEVTAQTNGDTFSTFTEKTVGVEGLSGETTDFLGNFNEKSIRLSEAGMTPTNEEFLVFKYNEINAIEVPEIDSASITNIQSLLGYSSGVFDGQKIIDKSIKSRSEAINRAKAVIQKYSNPIVTASFETDIHGLESGQLLRIKDTDNATRNIDRDFLIQKVQYKMTRDKNEIFYTYKVTCSTLVYGMLELLIQLLKTDRKIGVGKDQIVSNLISAFEEINISDIILSTVGGEIVTESIDLSDSVTTLSVTPPFRWAPYPTSTDHEIKWDLFQWS